MTIKLCGLCEDQGNKSRKGKPHDDLEKIDAARIYKGSNARGYQEQDYQCLNCRAKFTHSTGNNNLPWTLWRG